VTAPEPRTDVRRRETVGISLMASAETEAALEYLREHAPDAHVSFRDCYYKIERDGLLEFDLHRISDCLGRALDTDAFLVNMSSYYGRIVVSEDKIQICSDIEPDRSRE